MSQESIRQIPFELYAAALKTLLKQPIAYHKIFAQITGDVRAGVFLSQAYYWHDRGEDPDGWFYKTQKEWQEETCLDRKHQEKARQVLYGLGLWEENRKDVPAKLYYRLNIPKLFEAISAFLNVPIGQSVDFKELRKNGRIVQSEVAEKHKQERRKRALHVRTENTTQRLLPDIREESLKPSLTAPAVGDVLPLFSASPSLSNNETTDKPTPSVHDVRVAGSFAAGGVGSGGILPQVASGSLEGYPSLAFPVSTQPTPVSAQVRATSQTGKTKPKGVKMPKSPTDPRASHPAIAAVRDLAKRFPKDILWNKIIERLGDKPNIEKLSECYLAHVERGYNPNSWIWATEWYGGGIPQNNVKQKKERTYESPFGHLTAGFKSGENTEPNRFG